jgi:hypothetical protein
MALAIALVAIGMTFGTAAAAPAGGAEKPRPTTELTRMYRAEQLRLRVQGERLTHAATFAAKLDTLIAKLKAKGQDTSALEKAVAAFRASLGKARAEWQAAKDTLATHAGFDDTGKVTNADQARATLKDAHAHMEQAHTIAHQAFLTLKKAVAAYRKAHRNTPEVPAPVEP